MQFDLLGPWSGAVLAAIVALLAALLPGAIGRSALSGIAAPLGLCVGWIVTLGLPTASPRQLAERLPLLALAALPFGIAAAGAATRPVLLMPIIALGALGTGWWMAGAPLHGPDLARAALTIAAVAACTALAHRVMQASWQPVAAALVLAAALGLSTLAGPQFLLALIAAAAAAAAWIGGATPGHAMRLPLAMALSALLAVPPIARGATTDWLTAAAVPAALLLGPLAAQRLPREAIQLLAALLAALPILLAVAWYAGRLG